MWLGRTHKNFKKNIKDFIVKLMNQLIFKSKIYFLAFKIRNFSNCSQYEQFRRYFKWTISLRTRRKFILSKKINRSIRFYCIENWRFIISNYLVFNAFFVNGFRTNYKLSINYYAKTFIIVNIYYKQKLKIILIVILKKNLINYNFLKKFNRLTKF